jgi:hypothetical protein
MVFLPALGHKRGWEKENRFQTCFTYIWKPWETGDSRKKGAGNPADRRSSPHEPHSRVRTPMFLPRSPHTLGDAEVLPREGASPSRHRGGKGRRGRCRSNPPRGRRGPRGRRAEQRQRGLAPQTPELNPRVRTAASAGSRQPWPRALTMTGFRGDPGPP